jgi:hypothetical protein
VGFKNKPFIWHNSKIIAILLIFVLFHLAMTSDTLRKWLTIVQLKLAVLFPDIQTTTELDFLPATTRPETSKATKSTNAEFQRLVVFLERIQAIQLSVTSMNQSIPIKSIEVVLKKFKHVNSIYELLLAQIDATSRFDCNF